MSPTSALDYNLESQQAMEALELIYDSAMNRALRRRQRIIEAMDAPHLRALSKHSDLLTSISRKSDLLTSMSRKIEAVNQTHAFYSRFILPDKMWLSQLNKTVAFGKTAEILGLTDKHISGFANSIRQLNQPWLDAENRLASLTSVMEIYSMAAGLRDLNPFGQTVTDVFRLNLGDWRQVTVIPEQLYTDPVARFDFYTDLGFNDDLTNMPADAFIEILDSSGLRSSELPGLVEGYAYGLPEMVDDDSEDVVPDANVDAYQSIFELETKVRSFIDEQMTQQFGHQWVMQRIPPEMHQEWQKRRRIAIDKGEVEQKLIAYADFTDYIDIICKKDNWKSVFERFFKRKSNIQESFTRLYPVRLSTMHSRVIIPEDLLLAHAEVRRILRAIQFA